MARRLTKGGHQCVVFDRNRENVNALAKEGPAPAYSLEELVEKLSAPRAVWVMLILYPARAKATRGGRANGLTLGSSCAAAGWRAALRWRLTWRAPRSALSASKSIQLQIAGVSSVRSLLRPHSFAELAAVTCGSPK